MSSGSFKKCYLQTIFTIGPGDQGSIPGQIKPKTQKKKKKKNMVLENSLLNTQHKVWVKGKVKQSRERSSTLHHTLV